MNRHDDRHRSFVTAGLLVLLLCAAVGCSSALGTTHRGVASDPLPTHQGKGYTVEYLGNWPSVNGGKLISKADFEVADFPPGASAANGILDVIVAPAQTSVEGTVDDFVQRSEVTTGYRLLNRKAVRVTGGSPGYVLQQTGRIPATGGGSVPMKETDVFAINGSGDIVNLRLICQVNRCDAYRSRFDQVVRSLVVR